MPCLDQNQNSIDCGDPNCTYGDCTDQTASGALSGYADLGTLPGSTSSATGTPTGTVSPVAVASAGSGSGGAGFLSSFLNFGSSVVSKVLPSSTSTAGLQLKVNPATGISQYYNPQTGQWVGGPVSNTTSGLSGLFSGSSSIILLVIGLAIAAFFLVGRRRG